MPLVRPSSCTVKGGIPSSQRYLPTYLLPDRKELAQQDSVILLGVHSQAYIIHVCFHLGTLGSAFLHQGSTTWLGQDLVYLFL